MTVCLSLHHRYPCRPLEGALQAHHSAQYIISSRTLSDTGANSAGYHTVHIYYIYHSAYCLQTSQCLLLAMASPPSWLRQNGRSAVLRNSICSTVPHHAHTARKLNNAPSFANAEIESANQQPKPYLCTLQQPTLPPLPTCVDLPPCVPHPPPRMSAHAAAPPSAAC